MIHNEKVKKTKSAPAVAAPPSAQKPTGNLAPRDIQNLAQELVDYHSQYADLYQRREQREQAEFYLQGQLSDLERKTVEPMVLAMKGHDPNAIRAGQQFLGEGAWDDAAILAHREKLVAQDIGEADGVLICDGSGFPKKGEYSVGVQRQYCGALGKIANCQQGVFVAYASSLGYTFVDRRLYLPEVWFSEEYAEKRKRCGVPEELEFKTEPELALEMVKGIAEREQLPFQWVNADEHYGMNPAFLDGVAGLGKYYFVEVPKNTLVWPEEVEILPPGQGPMGAPRKGPRVAPETPKAQAVEQIGARAADSGLETSHHQGRQQRADHRRLCLCAGDEQAWAASRSRRLGSLPPQFGAGGGDQILLEQRARQLSAHDAGADERVALAGRDGHRRRQE